LALEKHSIKTGLNTLISSRQLNIPPTEIKVSKENILRALEMDLSVADNYLLDLIEDLTSKCLALAEMKGCYTIIPGPQFNTQSSSLRLNDQIFSLSKIVAAALKNSTYLALFVVSCGEKIEKFSKNLMHEGHTLEGLIVDLVASELAEGLADIIHTEVENEAARVKLRNTNRYSPGYCNWPVTDQRQLFALLKDNTCGVSLTDSSLMVPLKSVSGIIGIGPDVKYHGYACAKCDDKQCIYRNRR
jgi:hypothetical protein